MSCARCERPVVRDRLLCREHLDTEMRRIRREVAEAKRLAATCSVEGCDRFASAGPLCASHANGRSTAVERDHLDTGLAALDAQLDRA